MTILRECRAAIERHKFLVLATLPFSGLVCVLIGQIWEDIDRVQSDQYSRRTHIDSRRAHIDGDWDTLMQMRAKFPLIPLADRLSGLSLPENSLDHSMARSSSEAEEQLWDFEKKTMSNRRRRALMQLHNASYAGFVRNNGFGDGRMVVPFYPKEVLIPDYSPVRLSRASRTTDGDPSIGFSIDQSPPNMMSRDRLARFHSDTYLDFLNPTRLGVVPEFDQADYDQWGEPRRIQHPVPQSPPIRSEMHPLHPKSAGFTSHGMTSELDHSFQQQLSEWEISKLELVSLLKFPEPRVYLSKNLPSMEELKHAKTRLIDDFEQQGLQKLRSGEQIVAISHPNQIRMMGAVRAAKQCLACHTAGRGDLLGAFSYMLHRKQPIPEALQLEAFSLEQESPLPIPQIDKTESFAF